MCLWLDHGNKSLLRWSSPSACGSCNAIAWLSCGRCGLSTVVCSLSFDSSYTLPQALLPSAVIRMASVSGMSRQSVIKGITISIGHTNVWKDGCIFLIEKDAYCLCLCIVYSLCITMACCSLMSSYAGWSSHYVHAVNSECWNFLELLGPF